jgi:hypothetical protein
MEDGSVGDRVVVESERVGQPPREGKILEVLGKGAGAHYRVHWDNGHETTLYPSAGSAMIIHKTAKAGPN